MNKLACAGFAIEQAVTGARSFPFLCQTLTTQVAIRLPFNLSSAQRGQEVQLLNFADFPNPGLGGLSLSKCWSDVVLLLRWSSKCGQVKWSNHDYHGCSVWLKAPKCLLWFRILHTLLIKHQFLIVPYILFMWATPYGYVVIFSSEHLTWPSWIPVGPFVSIDSLKWALVPAAVYKGNAPVSGSWGMPGIRSFVSGEPVTMFY